MEGFVASVRSSAVKTALPLLRSTLEGGAAESRASGTLDTYGYCKCYWICVSLRERRFEPASSAYYELEFYNASYVGDALAIRLNN